MGQVVGRRDAKAHSHIFSPPRVPTLLFPVGAHDVRPETATVRMHAEYIEWNQNNGNYYGVKGEEEEDEKKYVLEVKKRKRAYTAIKGKLE